MNFFCMPSDFKNDTLDKYLEINNKYPNSTIIETYGQLTGGDSFSSCRALKDLPQINRSLLEGYIKHSKEKGIEFNYIINATCMEDEELTKSGYNKISEFLKMLEDIGTSWVTISMPSLMEIAKHVTPNLKIKASTVSHINSPLKAKFYEELGIKRIVLDEDIYRRFDILKSIRKVYTGDLEIIANSFCIIDCPFKIFHYNSFSHSNISKERYPYFSTRCGNSHVGAETYMKLNWVRPEDLHFYSDIGINFFKLQGRTNVHTGDPVRAVTHYIEGSYDGDLIGLLELFSDNKPLTIAGVTIDNRKLDGFFDKFANHPQSCKKVCSECGYCKSFGEASIGSSDRAMMDLMRMFGDVRLSDFPSAIEKPSL